MVHLSPIRYAGWAFFCAFLAADPRRFRSDSHKNLNGGIQMEVTINYNGRME